MWLAVTSRFENLPHSNIYHTLMKHGHNSPCCAILLFQKAFLGYFFSWLVQWTWKLDQNNHTCATFISLFRKALSRWSSRSAEPEQWIGSGGGPCGGMAAVPNVFSYHCDYNGSPSVFIHVLCFISSTRSTAAGRLWQRGCLRWWTTWTRYQLGAAGPSGPDCMRGFLLLTV